MKTVETNNTKRFNLPAIRPFFGKSYKGGYSLQAKETAHPFFTPRTIHPKLTISQPHDKYEQEANAMANKVVRMPDGVVQRACAAEQEEGIQTKPLMMESKDGGGVATSDLTAQLNSSKGSGSSLPEATNRSMSSAFGVDFSKVRVHTDNNAIQMSQGLNARAFTHGSDVYFNKGEYSLESTSGKRLLAHELTHVRQQRSGKSIQRWTGRSALAYARSLPTRYPGWLGVLPPCPCTFSVARRHPDFEFSRLNNLFTSTYHRGATDQVRSKNGHASIPGTGHGQQCTYDSRGRLITHGPGAGTPDVWSPNVSFLKHREYDVKTYDLLGSNIYVQYWKPNKGVSCPTVTAGGANIPVPSGTESKISDIRDLLYGWTSAADLSKIIRLLRGVTDPAEMDVIRRDIRPILVETLSDIGDRTKIRVELVRI